MRKHKAWTVEPINANRSLSVFLLVSSKKLERTHTHFISQMEQQLKLTVQNVHSLRVFCIVYDGTAVKQTFQLYPSRQLIVMEKFPNDVMYQLFAMLQRYIQRRRTGGSRGDWRPIIINLIIHDDSFHLFEQAKNSELQDMIRTYKPSLFLQASFSQVEKSRELFENALYLSLTNDKKQLTMFANYLSSSIERVMEAGAVRDYTIGVFNNMLQLFPSFKKLK